RLLRAGSVPISLADERVTRDLSSVDLVVADIRGDAAAAMASLERLRGAVSNAAIFVVAQATDPNLILQAMRAGANEFFTWPPEAAPFEEATRRISARR